MNAVWELFSAFLKTGLLSIGGGYAIIPLIQEQAVEKNGWITEKIFTDIITISQMTPGPLAVNTATFVGLTAGGISGAAAATIGCVLCGIVIALAVYQFFQTHQTSAYVLEVLNGLKSASSGLILSAAVLMIRLVLYGSTESELDVSAVNWIALFIFAVMLFVLRKWKLSPAVVILISGAAGFACYG